jgi:hypothetical protein
LNWWTQKQLRSMLMTDLSNLIPVGYFESKTDTFALNAAIANSGHISNEMRWGYLAGTLGKKLFFDNAIQMTARQKSAAEVLMNLGMYVSVTAAQQSCNALTELADKKGLPDGNAKEVSLQIQNQQLPVLTDNVNASLTQYLLHFSKEEAEPFSSLLHQDKSIKSKTSWLNKLTITNIFKIVPALAVILGLIGTIIGITVDWENFAKIVLEWSKNYSNGR